MKNRIQELVKELPQGVDSVLITSPCNRYYFTGMHSTAGTILVTREKSYFIIDFRYIELARRTVTSCEVILQDDLSKQLAELMERHGVKTAAVETSYLSLGEYSRFVKALPSVEILSGGEVDKAILRLRSAKDSGELACIKAAQKITEEGFLHILNYIRPGLTERQVAIELEHVMLLRGAEKLSFDTICVSGVNSSLPHGVPGEKSICAGDFVTLDFGVMVEGYCSDMTRTIAVGHATDEMLQVYDTVLRAQLAAIDAVKVGARCADVDAAARDLIYGAGYEGCFGHGTGHSVGLEIHEDPRFAPKSDAVCVPGMVMTVEPGIYLEGKFGCRIEDMVYIGEDKVEDLTHSPKELIIL